MKVRVSSNSAYNGLYLSSKNVFRCHQPAATACCGQAVVNNINSRIILWHATRNLKGCRILGKKIGGSGVALGRLVRESLFEPYSEPKAFVLLFLTSRFH